MKLGMKVAVPLYRDRLSARFEYATEILMIETGGGKIFSLTSIGFHNRMNVCDRVSEISRAGVSMVVCCRPSKPVAEALKEFGITIAEASLLNTEIEDIIEYVRQLASDISAIEVCSN